jgi:GNAT superfamily N-acetyltransferase
MLSIRPATPQDARLILDFIHDLAEYEREPEQAVATEADLLRDGFGASPKFKCVIAEWDRQPAGFAFYFYNYSTWQGRPGLYLEDLFVRPPFRGKGIGKAILVYLAQVAVSENCGRFQWQVLDWNQPAIDFYESLGARKLSEWITMRIDGVDLAKLTAASSALSRPRSTGID